MMTEAEYVASLEKMSFPQLEAHIEWLNTLSKSLVLKQSLAGRHRAAHEKYGRHSSNSDCGAPSVEQARAELGKHREMPKQQPDWVTAEQLRKALDKRRKL